jgi:hypothetical protein
MTLYSASRDHMRMNYIASEKRRNNFKGQEFYQTDEELGEEFDRGMAGIEAAAWADGYAADPTGSWDGDSTREGAPHNPHLPETDVPSS